MRQRCLLSVLRWAVVVLICGGLAGCARSASTASPARAVASAAPASTAASLDEPLTGCLSVPGQGTYAYRLVIPANWAGKYEVEERGNTVVFRYTVPADVREGLAAITMAPGLARPRPSEDLFSVSLLTETEWQKRQQEPGAGTAVGRLDGMVLVSNTAVANMYSAYSDEPWPQVAAEFQQMASQVPGILKSLEVIRDTTPRAMPAPAVTVARLERLADPCCPPVFAPDGRTYLTVKQGVLRLHSLDGGPARELPVAVQGQEGTTLRVGNAVWTPNGAAIIVTEGAPPAGQPAPLYVVDPANGAARRLGETYAPWRLTFDAHGRPVIATQTAFGLLDLISGNTFELRDIAPGSAPGAETELAFSPDGRYLAVLEGTQLSHVDLSMGRKTPLTNRIHPRWRAAMAWSEDSRRLAYATGEPGGAPELWVVAADGSGARRLLVREGDSDRGGAFAGLAWLPGTPYIVYQFVPSSNIATLQAEYQVVSAEGGPAKTLFTNGLGLRLSPDGHVISFTRDLEGAEETGNWIAVLEYAGGRPTATPGPTPAPTPVASETADITPLPRAFKGYELYSWREDSDWRFTLIEGTNRNKTYEEITSSDSGGMPKITVTGVEAIKAALARLPRGEQVFWHSEDWWEQTHQGAKGNLAQPEQAIVGDIVRHCEGLGVELRRP